MRDTAQRLVCGSALAVLFCAQAAGQTPLTCQLTNGAVTPTMRGEGLAERIGDIVLICSGGTPAASGTSLPQVNLTVTLNTNLTSRVFDATGASEAILTVDEPGAGLVGAVSTELACATPLTGCSITSNGGEPYDGTAGHPNVFEGVVSGNNSVTFYGVPLTAPGNFGIITEGADSPNTRVLRITNIRADAASFWNALVGSLSGGLMPTVQATVSIAGSPAVAIAPPDYAPGEFVGVALPAPGALLVGFPEFGLIYQTWNAANTAVAGPASLSACVAGSPCGVAVARFTENFATATLLRTSVAQQNVAGVVYNSESGFFNTTLASSNPNLATAGLADSATRLKASFQGVPAGAQLWVGLNSAGTGGAALTANEAGVLNLVAAGGAIANVPAAQLTVTNGSATAVWEVTSENPASIDTYEFPVWVVFPSGSTPAGALTIQGSFAPNADNGAFPLAGEGMAQLAAYPEPRFTSSAPPSLTIGETHGILVQGEASVSLTITVGNTGSATSGEVAVEDLLPSGVLTITGMSGSGWTCIVETLVCTRSDALALGQSYPPIYLTGNVLYTAPALFVNQLTVTGGGSNTVTASDTVAISGPGGGAVVATPSSVTATVPYGGSTIAQIVLTTSSATPIAFTLASPPVSWVTWYQSSGTSGFVSSGQSAAITVTLNGAGLSQTIQTSVLTVNLSLSTLIVPVTLYNGVTGSGGTGSLSVSPSTISWSYSTSSPGTLPSSTTLNMSSTNGAITYSATATSSNGWLLVNSGFSASGTVGVTPLTIAPGTNIVGLAPGTYAGTVFITGSDGSTVIVTVTATVTGTSAMPVSAVSVMPSSGSGASQTFALQYSDSAGARDLSAVYVWFTSDLDAAHTAYSCMAYYSLVANELYLENDAGSGTLGPVILGAGGILANSQCSLNVRAATVTSLGTNLTLTLPVTFTTAFPGVKSIYLYAVGSSANSGWQNLGTWTVPGPQQVLTVSSTHSGVFTQGQAGALYTVTVSDTGTGASLGQVTVMETLPAGLSLVSMSGSGWTCSGASCSRSDALAIGASYPSITVAVNVAANAGSPQINSVTVSGGGSASSSGTDPTVIVPPTTISVAAAPNPSEFGKAVTLTATVSPSGATGLVTFYDGVTVLGTDTLSNGQVVLSTILLASGARSLHAHYGGDGTHGASNSATTPQSVQAVSAVTFLPAVSYAASYAETVAIGDFNGDGKADLAISSPNSTGGYVRILLGNGDGTFTVGGDYYFTFAASTIAVGDFNGDGKLDLAVGTTGAPYIGVFPGNGDGTFQSAIITSLDATFYKIVAADFNGDGKLDLAGVGYDGTGVSVFLGNGDGTFQAPVSYGNANYTHSLAIADFNGDGKPDMAITNSADGSVIVLIGNGDGTFAPGVEYAAGGGTGGYLASVTTGDFNGDGKPDLAVTTAGLVVVLLGYGDGTFQPAVTFEGSQNPSAIVAADFNGDGFLDLAVTDSVAGTVNVFLGHGNGSFVSPPAAYNSGGSETYLLAAGEFNGDGRTDLAVANYGNGLIGSSSLTVLLASGAPGISCAPSSFSLTSFVNGSAISTTCSVTTVPAGATVTASAGTINGGEWLSVQGNGTSESPLVIIANPGSLAAGTYTGAITLQGGGASATVAVTLTIYNPPVLAITVTPVGTFTQGQTQAQYSVTVSNQAPGSQTGGVVAVTETVSSGLTLVSMSGYGWTCSGNTCTRSDALAGGGGYTQILMTVDVAAGATLPQTNSVTASGGNSAAATFVFNTGVISPATVSLASQTNPLVFGQAATLTATVMPSAATGRVTFYEGTTILGTSALSSGVASLSTILLPAGTGALKAYYGGDTAHGPNTSNLVTQSVNPRSGGAFTTGQSYTGTGFNSSVAGDFNGDGKADLAVIEEGGIVIYLGDGLGNLQQVATYLDESDPTSLAMGDFNGDGKVDLAVANYSGSVSMLLGNGDGTFQPAVNYTVAGEPYFIAVADFNGDGKADIVLVDGSGNVSILLGNGDGTFQSQINYNASASNLALAVGDFNGDGKADLATVIGGGAAVMLGNGDGTFQAPVSYAMSAFGLVLAVGDFNGDGKSDLAVADRSGNLDILLGNGDGTFRAGGSYPFGSYPECLTVSDFNGDGKSDLAVCSQTGVSLLLGNGDGTFQPYIAYSVGTFPESVVVADFNGDGRPDLALVGEGTPVISILLGSAAPVLTISSAHAGNFTQDQTGVTYTVAVSNYGGLPTNGTVTVTDTLPTGLTATAIGGTNWACTLATLTCTRSDVLNIDAGYTAITVTVNVAGNAAASVTNQVSVSGGGSAGASADDLTSIFIPCDLKQNGNITVADVQLIINQALGIIPAANFLDGGNAVSVVDVQIEINAALGLGCTAK